MDAIFGSTRLLNRGAGIAFGLGTQALFAATVWALFVFLRDGSRHVGEHWLIVDALLATQFAVCHSALLLPWVRSRISRFLPSSLYASLFCAATCAGLWLVFSFWRRSAAMIWDAQGPARIAIWSAFAGSWLSLFYSLHLSRFGYQSGWTQWICWWRRKPLPRRGLVERGAYRWLRHPVYMSFLGLIWFTPQMTADHLVLSTLWTVYVFVGSCLKDRRLTFYLGDTYREYANRVSGYPGVFFGRLGRWQRPAGSVPAGPMAAIRQETKSAA